jgi:hypothetical protein
MRGGLPQDLLHAAQKASPHYVFLSPTIPGLDFTDLLSISDVVLSKLGYGILADSIAAGVALLYPPRQGFREDDVSREHCPSYLRMREFPRDDFIAGRWNHHLSSLLAQSKPPQSLPTNGDELVAAELLRYFQDR